MQTFHWKLETFKDLLESHFLKTFLKKYVYLYLEENISKRTQNSSVDDFQSGSNTHKKAKYSKTSKGFIKNIQ